MFYAPSSSGASDNCCSDVRANRRSLDIASQRAKARVGDPGLIGMTFLIICQLPPEPPLLQQLVQQDLRLVRQRLRADDIVHTQGLFRLR
jgi:hypothetical protein